MKSVPSTSRLPKVDAATRRAVNALERASRVPTDALNIRFEPGTSGMTSTNLQDAILELWAALPP